jgi:Flp pilus assembly protein TadD
MKRTPDDDADAALRDLAKAIDLSQRGRLDEAEAVYARLLAKNGRDATVLVNAGMLALARNDARTAVARLRRAVEIMPGNPVARAPLEIALAREGDAE